MSDKQTSLEIRRRVSEHLSQNGVFDDLKRIVAEVVGSGGDETLAAINQKDVIAKIVQQQGGAATPVLPAGSSDDSFLHLTLLGGRAFVDSIMVSAGDASGAGPVRLCLHFGQQRFSSRPVAFSAEPSFDDTFLLRLPLPSGASSGAARAQALLRVKQPIHLLVLQRRGQRDVLLSSLLLEWRKVLQAGRCVLSAELPGVGAHAKLPVGSLEVRLELLPALLAEERPTEAQLLAVLKREREVEVAAERRLFDHAKEWWQQYLDARPAHKGRVVKLFALSEFGVQRPVCCFVRPLCAFRLLDSPTQAAHFVSLINFERHESVGTDDVWHTAHATLCRRCGDVEEHATLLCSLLLGFGLDAYVVTGTDERGAHTWVMSKAGDDGAVTFWESLTGQRLDYPSEVGRRPPLEATPYRTVGAAFNHEAFYANCQADDALPRTSLDLGDRAQWKPIDASLLRPLAPVPFAPLGPCSVRDRPRREEQLETELRRLVATHRASLSLGTEWDEQLSYLLAPALYSYETERLTGSAVGGAEFQLAIKRAVPQAHTFRGFPAHFTHMHAPSMLAQLLRSDVGLAIVQCGGDSARLAVRLRLFVYPDDVCAVWVMIASKHCPTPAAAAVAR